eukprot:1333196-Amphidinium_carterae.1
MQQERKEKPQKLKPRSPTARITWQSQINMSGPRGRLRRQLYSMSRQAEVKPQGISKLQTFQFMSTSPHV